MKRLFIIFMLLLLSGCGKEPKTVPETTTNSTAPAVPKEKLQVKSPALYDPAFLKCLEQMPDTLKLEDNYVIGYNDTLYFPEELKLKEGYHFTGFTDTHFYQADLTRTGLTTLEYSYVVLEGEKPVCSHKGTAVLNCGFVLGAESATDDVTGDGFFVSDYSDENGAALRVGEPDDEGRIRVIVHYSCNYKTAPESHGIILRESH
jgi:hypothetical protein